MSMYRVVRSDAEGRKRYLASATAGQPLSAVEAESLLFGSFEQAKRALEAHSQDAARNRWSIEEVVVQKS